MRGLEGANVVVTGATGFLGSYVVEALVNAGARVTAVAASLGWRPTVRRFAELGAVRFVKLEAFWEQTSLRSVADALEPAEHLVHLAYVFPSGSTRLEKAAVETQQNLVGTLRLMASMSCSLRTVCFASSVSVYGPEAPLPVSEDACAQPGSAYATAKLAAENFLRGYSTETGVRISILRYSTIYGPMETVPRAIPTFIRQTLAGGAPVVRGRGDEVHDYVHASDAARGTLLALASAQPGHDTDTYNIATGTGHTTRAIAWRVAGLAGTGVSVLHAPATERQSSIVCDIARARTDLGYEPEVALDDGLLEEIRWFRERPELWRTGQGQISPVSPKSR